MKFRDRAHFEEELMKTLEKAQHHDAEKKARHILDHPKFQAGWEACHREHPKANDPSHPDNENAVDHMEEHAEKTFGKLHPKVIEHLRSGIRDGLD